MEKKPLTDAQRIRLRKRVELDWLAKWRGRTDKVALLDLWRKWHWHRVITLEEFRRYKRQAGFYDGP